jgi:hypothetical protein
VEADQVPLYGVKTAVWHGMEKDATEGENNETNPGWNVDDNNLT